MQAAREGPPVHAVGFFSRSLGEAASHSRVGYPAPDSPQIPASFHITNCNARRTSRRFFIRDQVSAKANKPDESSRRPVTVTARKVLEANSSRMATPQRLERELPPRSSER
jgi:hypothetical protein